MVKNNMNKKSKKIIFTGGGSSGHVTPNLALIPLLSDNGFSVSYIGSKNGIEKTLIGELVPYYSISTGKLRRYFSFKNFLDIFKVLIGFFQSLLIIAKLKPDLVFSKGGFVSCPVVWASWFLRVPVFIHESDITTGLANKLSIPFAKRIFVTFNESLEHLPKNKTIISGLPLRKSILTGDKENGLKKCGFDENKSTILVIGGSLGALSINKVIHASIHDLLEKYNVCHLCGKGKINSSLENLSGYQQFEYVTDFLGDFYSMSDIIISRAGSTVINEIISLNKLNLLIPLSKKSSRGDQILNAASFEKKGLSLVIQDEEFSKEVLTKNLIILGERRSEFHKNMYEVNAKNPELIILNEIKSIL